MTEFKKFIVERHPDPDTLFVLDDDVFEQMCKLATDFAVQKVNVSLGSVSKSFTEKQIDDAYDNGFKDAMIKYRKD